MQYLLLIYRDEALQIPNDSPEFAEILTQYGALLDEAKAEGILVSAEPLQPVATATTVRKRNGRVELTDGPFAETKEQLAGYFLLDCKDLDHALSYAQRIPAAEVGSIEVRPIQEFHVPRKT